MNFFDQTFALGTFCKLADFWRQEILLCHIAYQILDFGISYCFWSTVIASCFCDLSFEYRCSFQIGMAHYLFNLDQRLEGMQMEFESWHWVSKPYTLTDHPKDLALELRLEFEVAHQHPFCLEW